MHHARFVISLFTVFLLVATPASLPAQSGGEQIEALIEQLASPDQSVREAAQRQLVEMGDEAREALEAHVRARAAALATLSQIETNRVASPTLVTLELKNVTVDEALAELFRQTGFTIPPQQESSWQQADFSRVSISCQESPFWVVLREIALQAGFTVYSHGQNLALMPSGQGGRNTMLYPAAQSGAFMIVVTSLQRTNSVDLTTPENIRRNLNMQVQVFPEPKVNVARASHSPQLDEAVDDKGNSLVQEQSGGGRSFSSGGQAAWTVSLPLRYPDEAGQRIARIRGSFAVIVHTRTEKLEVDDLASAGVSKTAGDYRVEITELRQPNENTRQLNVVIHTDSGGGQNAYALLNRPNIVLLDREGREWAFSGLGNSSGSSNQATGQLNFTRRVPGAGEPVSFRWEIPVATQEITVPFEFSDLPLP